MRRPAEKETMTQFLSGTRRPTVGLRVLSEVYELKDAYYKAFPENTAPRMKGREWLEYVIGLGLDQVLELIQQTQEPADEELPWA